MVFFGQSVLSRSLNTYIHYSSFSLPQTLLIINFTTWGLLMIGLPFATHVPTAGRYIFAAIVLMLFICIAGLYVMIPVSTGRLFGSAYFPANFGIVFSAMVS